MGTGNALLPLLLLSLGLLTYVAAEEGRSGKVFSLFNVVQFENAACQSESSLNGAYRNGTCYTSSECNDKKGTASGNCASGFGVCCLFIRDECGDTVTQNCTYIRNPNYPAALATTVSTCSYTIDKCDSDVCQFRKVLQKIFPNRGGFSTLCANVLDFEKFEIKGQSVTTEAVATTCDVDSMATTLSSSNSVPTMCGKNNGQHMYLDVGRGSSDSATLAFTINTATTFSRLWEIKVTQIKCSSALKAPDGCLQYFVGPIGRITTFNFEDDADVHLQNTKYSSCIRQEAGFCCVEYSLCSDTNSFTLDGSDATAKQDNSCTEDYIIIEGGTASIESTERQFTRFCGRVLSTTDGSDVASHPIYDCTPPYFVGFYADDAAETITTTSRGVCLNYNQIPCRN